MSQAHIQARAAEHVLSYAYPTSPTAKQLGFSKSGCFVIEVGGNATPACNFAEAKAVVQRLGTVPGRWSFDHPANSHMVHHMSLVN